MAATVYRYQWRGVNKKAIDLSIPSGVTIVVNDAMAKAWIDVSLDPGAPGSNAQIDLDAIMLTLGWIPHETNPTTPLQGITKKQEIFTSLTNDNSTNSGTFVDLISTPITTGNGFLDITAAVSSEAIATPGYFRLTLDGNPIAGTGAAHLIGLAGNALQAREPITAGAHTVALQWRTDALGTLNVNAASAPDAQSASLRVAEVVE